MVNFIHDEVIVEFPIDANLQRDIKRVDELMIKGMKEVIQHVNIKVEGTLMRSWYKEAKPVRNAAGELQIWEPPTAVV